MHKNISILGSGWLGIPLADALISQGHKIGLSTSSIIKKGELTSKGYQVDEIAISATSRLPSNFLSCDVLIIAITSKDIEAFKNLMIQLSNSAIKQVIFISSTSVFDFCNCEIDALANTNNSPIAQIERLFLEHIPEKTTILRFSGLFGYDRKPANFFRYKAISNPKTFVNMIHRDDCIAIIQRLIDKKVVSKQYNATADTHPTKEDFYTKASLDLGYSAPKVQESNKLMYKIISNKTLKEDLNYQFIYGDLMAIDFSKC